MTLPEAAVLTPLLHGAAMLLFPVTMGLSTALCLARAPSPFTMVAVHEYLTLTRVLDRLWLVGASAWIAYAFMQASTVSVLGALAAAVVLGMIVAHFWTHVTLVPELGASVERIHAAGAVTTMADDGVLVAERREPDAQLALPAATRGVPIYVVGGAATFALFLAVASGLGAASSAARGVHCLLIAGFYVSLGVFFIDLILDVWPGFTTRARLERASRYYVQIFEQWVNWGVLVAFLTVMIVPVVGYARGWVPVAAIAFPVWIGGCICFATFFNQVLHRRGVVPSRLPLPVWVNEYSVSSPLWAHFFTIIHVVMAVALGAGLLAVAPLIS